MISGLLEHLPADELEAVLAHEVSHVRPRDMAILTFASFFATVITSVWRLSLWFSRRRSVWLASLPLYALTWRVSFLLLSALSRYREYAADRGAAKLTGDASTLPRLAGQVLTELFFTHPLEHRLSALPRFQEHSGMNAAPITGANGWDAD